MLCGGWIWLPASLGLYIGMRGLRDAKCVMGENLSQLQCGGDF